jgi:hypothetical protein
LIQALKRQEEPEDVASRRPLWEWWPTLVLLFTLLTLEWAGRKLAGLP